MEGCCKRGLILTAFILTTVYTDVIDKLSMLVPLVRRICPICGGIMSEFPALSRRDNKTEICSDCGTHEALADIGVDIDDQEKIIVEIHKLSDKYKH